MAATPPSPATHARTTTGSWLPSRLPAPSLLSATIDSSYDHLFLPITLSFPNRKPISTFAFLDSGATRSHISESFVSVHSVPTRRLDVPQIVHTVDDRPLLSGALTDEAVAHLSILGSHSEHLSLGVVSMSYPIILGLDWLKRHNPLIDWKSGTLSLTCCQPDAAGTLLVHSIPPSELPRHSVNATSTPSLGHCPSETFTPLPNDLARSLAPDLPAPTPPSLSVDSSGPSPSTGDSANPPRGFDIKIIGYMRYQKCARTSGSVAGHISHSPVSYISSASLSAGSPDLSAEERLREIKSSLLEPYWDFASVFDPVDVDTLPPHRPYDIKIELEDGKTPLFGPIYSLTQDERAALADYIEKHLAKGFIRRSTSSAASPILFVKRKSGKLRLCVDYRGLNAITKRNRYPLPLISDLLDRVNGCKVFSKIDLKNAFNLIRIAEGDE